MNWTPCALSALLILATSPAFAQQATLYSDDFEGRRVAWRTGGMWNVDESPATAPGGHAYSGTKSLNFNDGRSYAGVGGARGATESPEIQSSPGGEVRVKFRCNYQTETTGLAYDQRKVRVRADSAVIADFQLGGARSVGRPLRCAAMGMWHVHEINVQVPQGQGRLKVEFSFNSVDDQYNGFAGWFVDDFAVSQVSAVPALAFNKVTNTTRDFRQLSIAVEVKSDRSVEIRRSSPTARYALVTGRATGPEFAALSDAIRGGRLASIPAAIPDPNVYIVAPTTFLLQVDSPVSTTHNTIGGSLGVYGQWAPQLGPVMQALRAIQTRLLSQPPPVSSDDHGDTRQTATALSYDPSQAATAGSIEAAGDVDWFQASEIVLLSHTSARVYTFETAVMGNADTVLELYDANGALITSDDDGGSGLASRIVHTTTGGTTLYLKVRHYSSTATGSYTIRASAANTVGGGNPALDDHGNTPQAATSISVQSAVTAGTIDVGGDEDWFQIQQAVIAIFPEPIFTYTIQANVIGNTDTVIELYAPNGTTLLASNDDASGLGYGSRIVYTGTASSLRFVKVRHYSSAGTGDYSLSVTAVMQ
jgi:hypothetical protein